MMEEDSSIAEEIRNVAETLSESCGSIGDRASDRLIELADRIDSEMVELPKDADGVPIRVGDVMENVINPSIHREVTGVGAECFYAWADGFGRYSQLDAPCYRHYREPTVEDVLREFADEVQRCCDTADTIAEYAKRLRLAESDPTCYVESVDSTAGLPAYNLSCGDTVFVHPGELMPSYCPYCGARVVDDDADD